MSSDWAERHRAERLRLLQQQQLLQRRMLRLKLPRRPADRPAQSDEDFLDLLDEPDEAEDGL